MGLRLCLLLSLETKQPFLILNAKNDINTLKKIHTSRGMDFRSAGLVYFSRFQSVWVGCGCLFGSGR